MAADGDGFQDRRECGRCGRWMQRVADGGIECAYCRSAERDGERVCGMCGDRFRRQGGLDNCGRCLAAHPQLRH